eukprot:TRINITY_DN800_c0_g1_i9.p1 TRINITY_DN800_c0_g1~~TRINITY_DN800_c0_g1_i9.p1  ORF type:complete len:308 (-),score=30.12 TRINITY_DN800_c0_g1_i9:143-1066(-)
MGSDYVKWLDDPNFFTPNANKSVSMHGTCLFTFVYADRLSSFPVEDYQIIIRLDSTKLPYQNDRRNVKLIKMIPELIFPWAQRVIWQDVKLMARKKLADIPVDYLGHFRNSVEKHGACASFMSMPIDEVTTGGLDVTLKAHCDEIIHAAEDRPTISDSLDELITQCEHYHDIYMNRSPESDVFHQSPLIDSAFMMFDLRNERCRQYNGDLLCSCLDEIHGYSDRDQVSFPSVFSSSGVHLLATSGGSHSDKIYVDQTATPTVHFEDSKCHWYYHQFAHCVGTTAGEISAVGTPSSMKNSPAVKKNLS